MKINAFYLFYIKTKIHDTCNNCFFIQVPVLVYIIVAFIYHQFLVELFTDLT